jgi:hypothetical protein
MKFVNHNKLLGNSNAESTEENAEKTKRISIFFSALISALSAPLR